MKTFVGQQKHQSGFSTLEILIAFAVMTLALVAVIQVVFGNQSMAVDTELAQRGLYLAEKDIEETGILAQTDFDSVSTTATTTPPDQPFSLKTSVFDISPCAKQVTSLVAWERGLRDLSTRLSSVLVSTSSAAAVGGNCSPTFPNADWDTPEAYDSTSASDFDGQGTGIAVTSIDGDRFAFLITDETNPGKNNFYSVDVSDPEIITPATDIHGIHVSDDGLVGVAAAKSDGDTYAFVLNNATSSQLQVIDVSNPALPIPIITAARTLPNVTPGEDPTPRSIYYYDEKVYVGTGYLAFGPAGWNEELHIFDVSDPTNPIWEDSVDVDRNVNDIFVRNDLAYLAVGEGGDDTPLKIHDVGTGALVGDFSISDDLQGTAVYVLGNRLYLGLEKAGGSHKDFYVIDVTDPSTPAEINSVQLGLIGANAAVASLTVQGPYAFLGMVNTNSQHTFQVFDVSEPETSLERIYFNTCTPGNPFPQNMTGMVFMDDLIFGSFRSNIQLRIIYDTPDICAP